MFRGGLLGPTSGWRPRAPTGPFVEQGRQDRSASAASPRCLATCTPPRSAACRAPPKGAAALCWCCWLQVVHGPRCIAQVLWHRDGPGIAWYKEFSLRYLKLASTGSQALSANQWSVHVGHTQHAGLVPLVLHTVVPPPQPPPPPPLLLLLPEGKRLPMGTPLPILIPRPPTPSSSTLSPWHFQPNMSL
eukprot:252025-Chlamydomonas_euryale.AAC.2